jgi:hypothetical protein
MQSPYGLVPLPESYPLTRWCVHFGGNSADIVIPSEAKESPPCPEGIPSSLALLGMTGESDPTFPPKTIRYRQRGFRRAYPGLVRPGRGLHRRPGPGPCLPEPRATTAAARNIGYFSLLCLPCPLMVQRAYKKSPAMWHHPGQRPGRRGRSDRSHHRTREPFASLALARHLPWRVGERLSF